MAWGEGFRAGERVNGPYGEGTIATKDFCEGKDPSQKGKLLRNVGIRKNLVPVIFDKLGCFWVAPIQIKRVRRHVMSDLKKPCHDDPDNVCECYESLSMDGKYEWCLILLNGGTWEDCRFGKDWKEPGPPAFEGD